MSVYRIMFQFAKTSRMDCLADSPLTLFGEWYYDYWNRNTEDRSIARLRIEARHGKMHIPDGILNGGICAGGYAVSVSVCGLAVAKADRVLAERETPLLGVLAAFIFAAQMLNFPIPGGTSGHFLGALIAAILIGPLNACLVMSVVLAIQCLFFADGGLTALGANIFNMGIGSAFGGYAVFAFLKAVAPRSRAGFLFSAALAAWVSVVVGSFLCAGELALSGAIPGRIVFPAMVGVGGLIGVGEAAITVSALSLILASRPDLIAAWSENESSPIIEVARP